MFGYWASIWVHLNRLGNFNKLNSFKVLVKCARDQRKMSEKLEKKHGGSVNVQPLVICDFKQTCFACPSQWEGTLEDGRMIYVRFRWSYLRITVSDKPTDDVMDAVDGKEIYGEQLRDGLDGILGEAELIEKTKHILTYPQSI